VGKGTEGAGREMDAIYLLYDVTQSLGTIVRERSCTVQGGKHVKEDVKHVRKGKVLHCLYVRQHAPSM
jgi:hypothetical protein